MYIRVFWVYRLIWLSVLITAFFYANADGQAIPDTTYQIPGIVIYANRERHFRNDIKTEEFSKDKLKDYAGESLGRFLSDNTSLNIKAYGAGGAATSIGLRGTSSSHVQVNWHGFPINSVTLGSYDFSMIPAGGFDKVSVVYGASGALYGSGTFGGAVNLDNDLKTEKALHGSAQVSYQSLKGVNGSLSFHAGGNKAAWKIYTWGAVSDNQFTYYDYIRQSLRKQNDGKWRDAGIIQHFTLSLSVSSILEAGMWYQVKSYNIPSRIGSVSNEFQKDSTLKIYIGYKKRASRWGLEMKAAIFSDEQDYQQKASEESGIVSIESDIATLQYQGNANFRYYFRSWLSLDIGFTGSLINADVTAYGGKKEEKGLSAFTGIKYDFHRLSWQATLRKEWNNTFNSGLLPSLGMAWEVLPDKWTIRTNISRKFRKPTFNDLYWLPGGNSALKPETGYTVEAGSSSILTEKENMKLSVDISIYRTRIKDMIIWRPSASYWMAENYQQVRIAGLDGGITFDISRERWKNSLSLKIALNRSLTKGGTNDEEEVMPYSPRIITSLENRFSAGITELVICHHFTADRYYDDDYLLDPYQTVDLKAGVNIPAGTGKIGAHLTVSNLTDTTYELIRLYPMPGRYWSVKMSYTF